MAPYKTTLLFALFVVVLLTIGMCVFTAIEKNSYAASFSLSIQIITTIGYGDYPPKTDGGKIFTIFYMLFGIPTNIILLQRVGQHLLDHQKNMIKRIELTLLKSESQYLPEKSFLLCFLSTWVLVFVFAGVQMHQENWSFLDGVYCFTVTFTTVGFGDIIPGHNSKNKIPSTILWPCFIYLGLCAMSNVINSIVYCIENQHIRKRLKQRTTAGHSVEDSSPNELATVA